MTTASTTDYKQAIQKLHFWSSSCEYKGDAWPLFLDLSGYSDEYLGCRQAHPKIQLGHLERTMLANALAAFVNHSSQDVHEWISETIDDLQV